MPQAIISFFESTDIEDAIRNAVSLGEDSDAQGAMPGLLLRLFMGVFLRQLLTKFSVGSMFD